MSLLGRLKTAIKGNPVLKEYELGRHVGSAGPGLLWKVYDGIKKTNRKVYNILTLCGCGPVTDMSCYYHVILYCLITGGISIYIL